MNLAVSLLNKHLSSEASTRKALSTFIEEYRLKVDLLDQKIYSLRKMVRYGQIKDTAFLPRSYFRYIPTSVTGGNGWVRSRQESPRKVLKTYIRQKYQQTDPSLCSQLLDAVTTVRAFYKERISQKREILESLMTTTRSWVHDFH